MTDHKPPDVSIVCITYRHENFIADALDSFLKQKTDFPFEILVGDDASPDQTGVIIAHYADLHPDKINPVLRKKNLGALRNLNDLISRAQGKYIAFCEGDDYWTDDLKLQKQKIFLDNNRDFTMCCHPVYQIFVDNSCPPSIIDPFSFFDSSAIQRNYFTIKELLTINFIPALSVMYRWQLGRSLPKWMMKHKIADYPMHLLHAANGHIGVINEIMGVYRRHPGAMWLNHETDKHKKIHLIDFYNLLNEVNCHLQYKFDEYFNPYLACISNEIVQLFNPRDRSLNSSFARYKIRSYLWKLKKRFQRFKK